MPAESREIFTLDEYLALERASERRFEFRNGVVVCMSGGTVEHAAISANIVGHLLNRLAGSSCRAFGADLAVRVPAGPPYRYPDASVVCGDVSYTVIDARHAVDNPVLIVEVLSKSSASYDRGTKFEEYKSIATLCDYLLVEQERPAIVHRSKLDDGGWVEREVSGLDASVRLPSLGIDLPLGEVYEGLTISAGRSE
jgi:Uma2 family endonuclease